MGKLIQYNEQRGIMFFKEEDNEEHRHLGVYDGTIVIADQGGVTVIPLIDRDEINYMLEQDYKSLCRIMSNRLILRNEDINENQIMHTIKHHCDEGWELDMLTENIIEILQVSGAISNDVRVVSVIRRLIEEYVKLKHPDYDE